MANCTARADLISQKAMHWIWTAVSFLTVNAVRVRMARRTQKIYLTFDDGPHPEHTPALLDLLKQHDAKATFFLIGTAAQRHPQIVRRMLDEGHTIGNHSMTHPRMPELSAREQLEDISRADAVLATFNGRARQMFRPPNGRATLATIVNSLVRAQPLILWSIDSCDYRLSAAQVTQRLTDEDVRAGDILLFHDDGGSARLALEFLLPHWLETGLQFGTL